jgi:hypothetical protein
MTVFTGSGMGMAVPVFPRFPWCAWPFWLFNGSRGVPGLSRFSPGSAEPCPFYNPTSSDWLETIKKLAKDELTQSSLLCIQLGAK